MKRILLYVMIKKFEFFFWIWTLCANELLLHFQNKLSQIYAWKNNTINKSLSSWSYQKHVSQYSFVFANNLKTIVLNFCPPSQIKRIQKKNNVNRVDESSLTANSIDRGFLKFMSYKTYFNCWRKLVSYYSIVAKKDEKK